ncbi:penicillin-binding protein 2 [Thermodesulfobacteriota bacterium]
MREYLNSIDQEWYKNRLARVIFAVMAAFIVLFVRLFYLQAVQGEEFRRLSENNCIRLKSLEPPRGLLFDNAGKLLVDNRPSFDLSIVLKDAKPAHDTFKRLSLYINGSADELQSKIARHKGIASYQPILLKQDIGRNALAAIEVRKFDLPGVVVDVRPLRHYVYKESAAHLIGYLGEIDAEELDCGRYTGCRVGDFIGKFGVEKTYEQYLRGRRGGQQVEVNATGQVIRVLKTVEARPGHNVYLTIDKTLQRKSEALLQGKAGAVIAMEPASGRVLAMTSSPAFDQNAFASGMSREHWNALIANPFRPMENKAVQAEYPPGSIYKIITAIAGLEEGVIDENTTLFCPGAYPFGDRVFRCWKKEGHGSMNILTALEESCDVFFYQTGQRLGIDRLARYAKGCGLGARTGIDLDHEAKGIVPTAAWKEQRTGIAWQKGETLSVAIGQGYNLVTPVQMAALISAIANGGARYKPLIMNRIVAATGTLVAENDRQVIGKIPVSRKTMDLVRKGLWNVVNGVRGTARGIRIPGIGISGKTGTAQVFSRKTDDQLREEDLAMHLKSHAWFLAYAPEENPQIAIAVIVEHGEHGSSAAAPIAKELIKTYLLDKEHRGHLKAEGSNLRSRRNTGDG